MTAGQGGGSNRRGVVAALLVALNLVLVGLNLDKHDALPFSTGLWSSDDETATGDGSEVDAGADDDGTAGNDDPAAPSTDTSVADSSGSTVPAGGTGADSSRALALQSELSRVTASTPIIFESGVTAISDLHVRILNSVASIMTAYPELVVKVVGYTDGAGTPEANEQFSLQRAEAVKAYLVSQGVPEGNLQVEANGETSSSGSEALASLERRVEFEVGDGTSAAPADGASPIRIAIVAPSARNDVAFTQSMVDAVETIAAERGNVEVAITDSTFVLDEAAAAIRGYAEQDYDLVIGHGSQFGTAIFEIAPEFPDIAFAWGTAADTFDLPNVYAYDAASQEGGYVLGAMATLLSSSDVVGVVGPIEVGDAKLYIEGFQAGAAAERPSSSVRVTYTGSFSDVTLAADAARAHVDAGADVMTGSAQMVVGAVSVASEGGTLWFGTQSNQAALAPNLVVASQVYHWEVILNQILTELDSGALAGGTYTANLANGGLVIEYNPDYALPDDVRARADQLTASIIDGSVVVPTPG